MQSDDTGGAVGLLAGEAGPGLGRHLLEHHQADLAVGGRPPGDGRFVTLATRPNVLVLVAEGIGKPSVREVDVETLARSVVPVREEGSGTRGTAEELLDELGVDPRTLTLGSNGAIRESVQVGLGITLISRNAVVRELDEGTLEEWRCADLPCQRVWHVVARAHEHLPATAGLFLTHLVGAGDDGFTLVREASRANVRQSGPCPPDTAEAALRGAYEQGVQCDGPLVRNTGYRTSMVLSGSRSPLGSRLRRMADQRSTGASRQSQPRIGGLPSEVSAPPFSDRRYQVFVSSTFSDLAAYRKQAVEVIFRYGHIPIALENFAAKNRSDLEVITDVMKDCQIYVLILGHRYGEIVPGQDISFTELEYRIAEANGLLILTFLMKEEEIAQLRSNLDPEDARDRKEIANHDRLQRFHGSLRRFRTLWAPGDDFRYLVLQSLGSNLDACDKPGFIREPSPKGTAMVLSADENPILLDIARRLEGFSALHERCSQQVEEKEALSRWLRDYYLDRIIRKKVSLFFESGSTVAYVARAFAEDLASARLKPEDTAARISTNNVLAYLEYWLNFRIPCNPFPYGPPSEETFGASYGGLESIVPKAPDFSCEPLDWVAKREIGQLLKAEFGLDFQLPVLLIGAVSGLKLSAEVPIQFPDNLDKDRKQSLEQQIRDCYGPHVGSYHNKLFKRFMYETKMPLLIAITGEKVDAPIEAADTHFILDSEYTWTRFSQEHPLAFGVGCQQADRSRLIKVFDDLGFQIVEASFAEKVPAFIARNTAFIDQFESLLQ